MAEVKTASKASGQIQIADEVIAIIAGTAALEIDGVSGMVGNFTGGIIEKLGKKNLGKGVLVTVTENEVKIDLNLIVKSGYKIQDVSAEVQKRVKTAIETMTGLSAVEININVTSLEYEKKNSQSPVEGVEELL